MRQGIAFLGDLGSDMDLLSPIYFQLQLVEGSDFELWGEDRRKEKGRIFRWATLTQEYETVSWEVWQWVLL